MTQTKEELLKYAKINYPAGTVFKSAYSAKRDKEISYYTVKDSKYIACVLALVGGASMYNYKDLSPTDSYHKTVINVLKYEGVLDLWYNIVYKEEDIKIGDHTVEFKDNEIKVGCKTVSEEDLIVLKKARSIMDVLGVYFKEGHYWYNDQNLSKQYFKIIKYFKI